MLTNRKLYTLDTKLFLKGEMDKMKLIKNTIDLEYLSHLIFFPDFPFEMYKHLNIRTQSPKIIEEFKK